MGPSGRLNQLCGLQADAWTSCVTMGPSGRLNQLCGENTIFKEERNGQKVYAKLVKFFAWEELDYVDKVKATFKLD